MEIQNWKKLDTDGMVISDQEHGQGVDLDGRHQICLICVNAFVQCYHDCF